MKFFVIILIYLIFLVSPASAKDSKAIATAHFSIAEKVMRGLVANQGAANLLLVIDIDNTALAMNGDLGSDQWYNWQVSLMKKGVTGLPAVSPTLDGLYVVQGWVFQIAKMHPVAPEMPAWIRELKAKGGAVIALTSRGIEYHDATIRELTRNGFHLSTHQELGYAGPGEPFLPYDMASLEASGLTTEDIRRFNLGPARHVMFDRGVLLGGGQHKGAMLRALLARLRREFKTIVFMDDHSRNVLAVKMAFDNRPENLMAIHYTRSKAEVERFDRDDKQGVIREWCTLFAGLKDSILRDEGALAFNGCPGTPIQHQNRSHPAGGT